MTAQAPEAPPLSPSARPRPRLLRRWPAAAGLAFAAVVAVGLTNGVELASVLAASAVVYLGAAALRKPAAAWPLFFATVVAITVAKVVDDRFHGTWFVLGLGVVLLGYGLARGYVRPRAALPLQTVALLGFGAIAAGALFVAPELGAYLVAAGLLGHAAWDAYHHRADRVVVRSMAEFCVFLDTALALVIVGVTALT